MNKFDILTEEEREMLGYCYRDAMDGDYGGGLIEEQFMNRMNGECHPRMYVGDWYRLWRKVVSIKKDGDLLELIESIQRSLGVNP